MKKGMLVLVLANLSILLFAGPFGFNKGMSLKDVTEVCITAPEHLADDRYMVLPQKTHPDFEVYIVWISDSHGLYYVKAISREVTTNPYGTELQALFATIENSLINIYGESLFKDEIDPESLFKDERHWMYALQEGARKYYSTWSSNGEAPLKDALLCICLYATSDGETTGYIMLDYEFDNHEAVRQDLESVF